LQERKCVAGEFGAMRYSHILVDGNNLAYKNFYTQRDLSAIVRGETIRTGVAFGCLSSLASLSRRWLKEDGSIIIVWDRGYKRKLSIYPDYKKERRANRDAEEFKDFKQQRDLFEKLLRLTRFSSASAEGEEADDVLATLMLNILMVSRDAEILIVSSDRDMYQLISDRVSQMIISRSGKEQILNPEAIRKVYGVKPVDYVLIQLMIGDKGDGVPGVHLIGPKTAAKIIEASSEEELVTFLVSDGLEFPKALSEWLKKKGRSITETKKLFKTTFKLLRLHINLPSRIVKVKRGKRNENRLVDLFVELEFMSFLKGKKMQEFV